MQTQEDSKDTKNRTVAFTKVKLPYGWLGNMSPHPIEYEGKIFRTAEALFQALRFNDDVIIELIREQKSPIAAKSVARDHISFAIVEPRGEKDLSNMEKVLRLKLAQHPDLEDALLETGDALIIEDCTNRAGKVGSLYWGAVLREDGTWIGENILGGLWMKLREEIKAIE